MTIDEMLKTPGLYEASNRYMAARGLCLLVEVDAAGVAYQLNGAGQRDGELARDGWTEDAFATRINTK